MDGADLIPSYAKFRLMQISRKNFFKSALCRLIAKYSRVIRQNSLKSALCRLRFLGYVSVCRDNAEISSKWSWLVPRFLEYICVFRDDSELSSTWSRLVPRFLECICISRNDAELFQLMPSTSSNVPSYPKFWLIECRVIEGLLYTHFWSFAHNSRPIHHRHLRLCINILLDICMCLI